MEYSKALVQISEIHAQLAKGEVYRGFRSLPVAASAVAGVIAAAAQPHVVGSDPIAVVRYWVAAGIACGMIGSAETAYNYLMREDTFSRRRTRNVLGQFVPGLAAGAALTLALGVAGEDSLVRLLPGLWAMLFGLAIFSARPYLPRASGWVALGYLAAGCFQIALPPASAWAFGWMVGITFGVGQLAAALVLFWNVERNDHG